MRYSEFKLLKKSIFLFVSAMLIIKKYKKHNFQYKIILLHEAFRNGVTFSSENVILKIGFYFIFT